MTLGACLLAALTSSASAFAQEGEPAAPEGEPANDAAAPAAPAKDDDVPATADTKATERAGDDDVADDGEDADGVRFRGGFLAPSIGPAFGDGISGAAVGLFKLQLGAQINHYIGVIYDGGPIVAAFGGDGSVGGGFIWQNSAMAVLSLGKHVYFDVGAGPSLDAYTFGEATASSASVGGGAAPGIATKIAIGFGGGPDRENARRVAFKLSVDPHFTFFPGTALIYIPIGIGVEWF